MKSKSRKKKEVVVEEKPVVVEPVDISVKRNVNLVKDILVEMNPDLADAIRNGDNAYICNRFLQNEANRVEMAKSLNLEPVKCSMCCNDIKGYECCHFSFALNNCRNGLLSWLETEVKE